MRKDEATSIILMNIYPLQNDAQFIRVKNLDFYYLMESL